MFAEGRCWHWSWGSRESLAERRVVDYLASEIDRGGACSRSEAESWRSGRFAAAVWLRESILPVPTTLLAQVDSSVGRKNRHQYEAGRSRRGFHQPRESNFHRFAHDPSAREFAAGWPSEKYGLLGDSELFTQLEQQSCPLDPRLAALSGGVVRSRRASWRTMNASPPGRRARASEPWQPLRTRLRTWRNAPICTVKQSRSDCARCAAAHAMVVCAADVARVERVLKATPCHHVARAAPVRGLTAAMLRDKKVRAADSVRRAGKLEKRRRRTPCRRRWSRKASDRSALNECSGQILNAELAVMGVLSPRPSRLACFVGIGNEAAQPFLPSAGCGEASPIFSWFNPNGAVFRHVSEVCSQERLIG